MNEYTLHHEYFALLRYRVRHHYNQFPEVNREWYDAEIAAIARSIAHDKRPTEEESYKIRSKYLVVTYFPFLKEVDQ